MSTSPDYPEGLIVPPRRRKASDPKPEPVSGREVMNAEQAAAFLGLGLTTLYREKKRGLPFKKLGGRTLFVRSDLLKWVGKLPTG